MSLIHKYLGAVVGQPNTSQEMATLLSALANGLEDLDKNFDEVTVNQIGGDKFKITEDGGFAVKLINGTGAASVKGTLVTMSNTLERSVEVSSVDDYAMVGWIHEDGIANGEEVWVVTHGFAEALVEDSLSVQTGDLMICGATTPGRVQAFGSPPPPPTDAEHFREVGHAVTSTDGGTDNTVFILPHWN